MSKAADGKLDLFERSGRRHTAGMSGCSEFLGEIIQVVQFISLFSSPAESCLTLCNPINHSMLGLPVHHQLLEFTQIMASEWVMPSPISSSVIPVSCCLQSFPASGSFQMNQLSHQVAKVLEFQLQHQSFQ